jgi:cytosine/uracil/thiamine/allantoin permease
MAVAAPLLPLLFIGFVIWIVLRAAQPPAVAR